MKKFLFFVVEDNLGFIFKFFYSKMVVVNVIENVLCVRYINMYYV